MKLLRLSLFVSLCYFLQSCSKDDTPQQPVNPDSGFYVLSEGAFFGNNAKLGFYSNATGTFAGDYFAQQNPSNAVLGDVATEVFIYGAKMYVIVNNSNHIQVLNPRNGTLIQTITFPTPNKQPRYGVGANGKILITAYDGTLNVIDTTTFALDHTITVGLNPEGIAVVGDYAYIANSGGLNFPVYDSTVSVVSLSSYTEVEKITVGKNPNAVIADAAGNIYVSILGDYASITPKLVKINTSSRTITNEAPIAVGVLRYHNNMIYATGGYLGSSTVQLINPSDLSIVRSNFVTDGTSIVMPYGITIDETNGDVYITDAKDFTATGELFCFNQTGAKKFSFSTSPGVNPVRVAFVR